MIKGRILSLARSILARSEPAALSIRDLANEAGVSSATIYRIFGSKNMILREILREEVGALRERVARLDCDNSIERLFGAIRLSAEAYYEAPGFMMAVTACLFGQSSDLQSTIRDPGAGLWRTALTEMAEEGYLSPAFDIDILSYNVLATYIGILRLLAIEEMPLSVFRAHLDVAIGMLCLAAVTDHGRQLLLGKITAAQALLQNAGSTAAATPAEARL